MLIIKSSVSPRSEAPHGPISEGFEACVDRILKRVSPLYAPKGMFIFVFLVGNHGGKALIILLIRPL